MVVRWLHLRKPKVTDRVELEVVDLASHRRQVIAITMADGTNGLNPSLPRAVSWIDNDTVVVYSMYPSLKVYKIRL